MISIDPSDKTPIFEQLCRSVCREIAAGDLREGDRLPSARELAKLLQLNPNTVAKAYGLLERDGIIYSVAGKGCFVAKHGGKASEKLTENFRSAVREALDAGVSAEELIEIIKAQSKDKERER
ncbi:MAG: GntR family transcriptional regulator [Ruminococcus sp.]|nr:GntR family transcriptional regulator [Ruminococcus sp.]